MSLGQQHRFCGSSLGWDEPRTRESRGLEGSAGGKGLRCQPGVTGKGHSLVPAAVTALQRPWAPSVGVMEQLQGSGPSTGNPPRLDQPRCNRRGCETTERDERWALKGGSSQVCPALSPHGEDDSQDTYTEGQ